MPIDGIPDKRFWVCYESANNSKYWHFMGMVLDYGSNLDDALIQKIKKCYAEVYKNNPDILPGIHDNGSWICGKGITPPDFENAKLPESQKLYPKHPEHEAFVTEQADRLITLAQAIEEHFLPQWEREAKKS